MGGCRDLLKRPCCLCRRTLPAKSLIGHCHWLRDSTINRFCKSWRKFGTSMWLQLWSLPTWGQTLSRTSEVDFLHGEVVMGDFLDGPEMQHVALFESMAWARWAQLADAYEARADEGDKLVLSRMIRPAITENAPRGCTHVVDMTSWRHPFWYCSCPNDLI